MCKVFCVSHMRSSDELSLKRIFYVSKWCLRNVCFRWIILKMNLIWYHKIGWKSHKHDDKFQTHIQRMCFSYTKCDNSLRAISSNHFQWKMNTEGLIGMCMWMIASAQSHLTRLSLASLFGYFQKTKTKLRFNIELFTWIKTCWTIYGRTATVWLL